MRVKVSNVMIKEMKKILPENYSIYLLEMNPELYRIHIDADIFRNESDFDYKKNVFKVIQVVYPPEYYAMPRYITTNDLHKIYKHSDGTFNGFFHELKNDCEV